MWLPSIVTYFPILQFPTILGLVSSLDKYGSTSLQHMTDHMPLKKKFISPPLLPHMAGWSFITPDGRTCCSAIPK